MKPYDYPPPFMENRVQRMLRTRVYPLLLGPLGLPFYLASFALLYVGVMVMIFNFTSGTWLLGVVGLLVAALGLVGVISPIMATSANSRKRRYDHLVFMAEFAAGSERLMQRIYAARRVSVPGVDNTGHVVIEGEVVEG